ncbi:uncharacterized protein LACBIDRAFT_326634 [Laccaria bicolor S238N-H82]|uniref:Predicted protein n=1 Tax=Laccaria bicolor (strain S238N-H82 / ATCC MYA-4686) TaxID=486041 RepID=B0D9A5_LACBS|nr:uncharacterized protein LACBIDRAFT_326634 [Laccaria bicolor S238N-H82]EDR09214.1 predicted protein [Laccaria bicolor S238N-H82]|eukprot:XP_001880527.1 predicted protein [Laccaria bicolor S238N-H82]
MPGATLPTATWQPNDRRRDFVVHCSVLIITPRHVCHDVTTSPQPHHRDTPRQPHHNHVTTTYHDHVTTMYHDHVTTTYHDTSALCHVTQPPPLQTTTAAQQTNNDQHTPWRQSHERARPPHSQRRGNYGTHTDDE